MPPNEARYLDYDEPSYATQRHRLQPEITASVQLAPTLGKGCARWGLDGQGPAVPAFPAPCPTDRQHFAGEAGARGVFPVAQVGLVVAQTLRRYWPPTSKKVWLI